MVYSMAPRRTSRRTAGCVIGVTMRTEWHLEQVLATPAGRETRALRNPTIHAMLRAMLRAMLHSLSPAHRARGIAAWMLVATVLSTAAAGQSTGQVANPPAAPPASAPASPSQAGRPNSDASIARSDAAANAILYPGDLVRLKIWREPDLSGDFAVDEHGLVVFPKIGQVHVSDITTDSLRRMLVGTYSQYLRDPSIEITMLRRVTVLGSVKNPGLYPVDPTMTISDVLALAGGADPNGNQDKLELIRGGKRQPMRFTERTPVNETAIRSGDELYLPERSWISRNGYIVGAMIGAAVIVTTTLITHP
jgi:protein involved in polysaccharide export with SLBB domain